jgi:hypothetical protein
MNIELTKKKELEEAVSKKPLPLPASNIAAKPKRWTTEVELEYDPAKDEFYDKNTKRPIFALLDSEADETYFDTDTEIDSLEFESDNSEWIKKGGGGKLKLEELLGIQSSKRLRVREKAEAQNVGSFDPRNTLKNR